MKRTKQEKLTIKIRMELRKHFLDSLKEMHRSAVDCNEADLVFELTVLFLIKEFEHDRESATKKANLFLNVW